MVHRTCSIEINNQSSSTLANPRVYTDSGCCEVPLPPTVDPSTEGAALFSKTTGAATGAVGVFTYDLINPNTNDYTHSLAVMFSVPYDRNLYSNWFAVGIFERGLDCDYNLYDIMYNGSEDKFARGKADGSSIKYEGGVTISATMADAHEATVRVEINDNCNNPGYGGGFGGGNPEFGGGNPGFGGGNPGFGGGNPGFGGGNSGFGGGNPGFGGGNREFGGGNREFGGGNPEFGGGDGYGDGGYGY